MRNLILQLLKESESEPALNSREVVLFKFLNKVKQKGLRKDLFYDEVGRGLRMFSLNPKDTNYYYELFNANYREDGAYDKIQKWEMKGPETFRQKRIRSNHEARYYTKHKAPFKGNNLSGDWYRDYDGVDYYAVKSYNWYPIYLYKKGVWYEVIDRYSSSTSKHISYSNPFSYDSKLELTVVPVDKKEMEILTSRGGLDKVIESRRESMIRYKDLYKSRYKEKLITPWDSDTPVKIRFKMKDIKQKNNDILIEVEVVDVFRREGSKIVKTGEDYLKGEIEGASKKEVEDRVENFMKKELYGYFPQNVDLNIKFKFKHSKK